MRRFGEKLAALRQREHMTQRMLAAAIGHVSATYISKLEHGKEEPSLKLVLKVAEIFNVSVDQLVKDDLEVDG